MNETLKTLYEDKNIALEQGEGIYRITFFKDCHWAGDVVLNSEGIIANDLGEKEVETHIHYLPIGEELARVSQEVSKKMTDVIIRQLEKEKENGTGKSH